MLNGKTTGFAPAPLKLIDDPKACEFFADELTGISHVNGIVTLTFSTVLCDHSQTPPTNYRKVSGRARLTLPATMGAKQTLIQMVEQLEQQGTMVVPSQTPPSPHPLQ